MADAAFDLGRFVTGVEAHDVDGAGSGPAERGDQFGEHAQGGGVVAGDAVARVALDGEVDGVEHGGPPQANRDALEAHRGLIRQSDLRGDGGFDAWRAHRLTWPWT